jgi:hypothetical protein
MKMQETRHDSVEAWRSRERTAGNLIPCPAVTEIRKEACRGRVERYLKYRHARKGAEDRMLEAPNEVFPYPCNQCSTADRIKKDYAKDARKDHHYE